MNSLKKFKKLIIEGKQSGLQLENKPQVDLKVPQIRESAYKIIHRKKNRQLNNNEHSLTRKQQIKVPSETCSPIKIKNDVLQDITSDIHNTQSSNYQTYDPKLTLLQLTEEELEYLQRIVTVDDKRQESRLKLQQKITGLRKNHTSTNFHKKQQSNFRRKHHDSDLQTQVLSVPSSLQDFHKLDNESNTSTIQKSKIQDRKYSDFNQKSDLEFKKIMYILESKSRAVDLKKEPEPEPIKSKQSMNNYRLIEEVTTPSISFRGNKQPQKKAELMEIVSMLNTKYKKNIKFN